MKIMKNIVLYNIFYYDEASQRKLIYKGGMLMVVIENVMKL
jgi:Cu2+-containing amine oxidase